MPAPSLRGYFARNYNHLDDFARSHRWLVAGCIAAIDFILVAMVALRVDYTEIDWSTYSQQVRKFIAGERDYRLIDGDTGPIVYPANFLYIYTILYYISGRGTSLLAVQVVFCIFHALNVFVVVRTYLQDNSIPLPVLLLPLCSRRVASIYVLRMFNDGVEALLANSFILLFSMRKFLLGSFLLSMAVGVKMNGLLYVPAVGIILLEELGFKKTGLGVGICLLTQFVIAIPFLGNIESYLGRAFEFSREFLHKWSVNYAFLNKQLFNSQILSLVLLVAHLIVLLLFSQVVWTFKFGGILGLLKLRPRGKRDWLRAGSATISTASIVTALMTCNLIGVAFARTIHYQFYAWYFHSLPYLLWKTELPLAARVVILAAIETVYNVYPPHPLSALVLHACHFTIIYAIYLVDGIYVPRAAIKKKFI
eukprot:Plantae.Rhodophyta-Purpureofilum_apyrenoidigerum.ctg5905.p1 GENE.Plantae.Rhodophyta-Purpureofilum_apyrenoidigerum.ctg5905~~Plantae.Rhodophyta-Purpureofilum_apyrenoidigerum.ctg5905.p1  ORF type:complete len:422 (+),score=46.08 Plantae.Rhodophyta-Purpureofilum_apyrenoidigerum.ctg5905:301-1566(+)